MLKKTIKFKNFLDQEVEQDFYFNLTKAEILELNIRNDLEQIGKGGNPNQIMDAFTNIMRGAYGVRENGGTDFVKTPEAFERFRTSEAYSELFVSFFTDTKAGAEFINALIPADIRQDIADNTGGMTPSELARARSEANLQGHNKPAEPAPTQLTFTPPPADTPPVQVPAPEQPAEPVELKIFRTPEGITEGAFQAELRRRQQAGEQL